jgi:hypothetical protein
MSGAIGFHAPGPGDSIPAAAEIWQDDELAGAGCHTTKARLDIVRSSALINSLCGRSAMGPSAAASAEIIHAPGRLASGVVSSTGRRRLGHPPPPQGRLQAPLRSRTLCRDRKDGVKVYLR